MGFVFLMIVFLSLSRYEDLRALDGGKDGLSVILPILKYSTKHLNSEVNPGARLFLEVDPCHPLLLPEAISAEGPEIQMEIEEVVQDFRGKDRFLVLKKK